MDKKTNFFPFAAIVHVYLIFENKTKILNTKTMRKCYFFNNWYFGSWTSINEHRYIHHNRNPNFNCHPNSISMMFYMQNVP